MRSAAPGIPTRSSISIARVFAALRSSFSCRTSVSRICSPTEYTGLSDVIGSWKIIEISLPRTARIVDGQIVFRGRNLSVDDAAGRLGHEAQNRQRGHAFAA